MAQFSARATIQFIYTVNHTVIYCNAPILFLSTSVNLMFNMLGIVRIVKVQSDGFFTSRMVDLENVFADF